MKIHLKLIFYFIVVIFLFACADKNKDNLTNPVVFLSDHAPVWTIYGDYLNAMDCERKDLVDNKSSKIEFNYKQENNTVIKLYWDGSIAPSFNDGLRVNYYGFFLKFTTPKDLTNAGYNNIKFSVKGTLNNNILEVRGINGSLSDKIQDSNNTVLDFITSYNLLAGSEFKIPITDSLSSVSEIISFAVKSTNPFDPYNFIESNGDESTLYIDNISLIKEL